MLLDRKLVLELEGTLLELDDSELKLLELEDELLVIALLELELLELKLLELELLGTKLLELELLELELLGTKLLELELTELLVRLDELGTNELDEDTTELEVGGIDDRDDSVKDSDDELFGSSEDDGVELDRLDSDVIGVRELGEKVSEELCDEDDDRESSSVEGVVVEPIDEDVMVFELELVIQGFSDVVDISEEKEVVKVPDEEIVAQELIELSAEFSACEVDAGVLLSVLP